MPGPWNGECSAAGAIAAAPFLRCLRAGSASPTWQAPLAGQISLCLL